MCEWTRVDEALPDVDTDTLLVSVKLEPGYEQDGKSLISDTDGFENGEFCFWGNSHYKKFATVVKWMYLPEPEE